ncbi:hypothetical protein EJB05_13295, partial [Eragrostis curvula]
MRLPGSHGSRQDRKARRSTAWTDTRRPRNDSADGDDETDCKRKRTTARKATRTAAVWAATLIGMQTAAVGDVDLQTAAVGDDGEGVAHGGVPGCSGGAANRRDGGWDGQSCGVGGWCGAGGVDEGEFRERFGGFLPVAAKMIEMEVLGNKQEGQAY